MEAEGIPVSAGYGFSLPDQPMLRNKAFGPYLPGASASLDYREARCPNSDLICREQCVWLGHNLLLSGGFAALCGRNTAGLGRFALREVREELEVAVPLAS